MEKATFRKGRLSNPLDFTWNWKVFKDFCESSSVELPERWKKKGQLTPEDEKWLAEFNIDVFNRYFLGKDDEEPERKEFWNLFIENNPDACYIPESKKEEENEDNNSEDEKEIEIEIGEFLEFFWHIKEKYSTSFDGVYENVQKPNSEKILENLTKTISNKLDEIIKLLEPEEDGEEENIIIKLQIEVELLKEKVNELKNR